MSDHPLTHEEYTAIYKRVPRLSVELVIRSSSGILLAKRAIEPFVGNWHFPGGTVRWGERLVDAAARVAHREVNLQSRPGAIPLTWTQIGAIEYPSHIAAGIDSPVGIAMLCSLYGIDELAFIAHQRPNHEASELGWFRYPPPGMHVDQVEFFKSRIEKGPVP